MTKDELFELYGRVQKKDKVAEDLLIAEHKKHWPHHHPVHRSSTIDYRDTLHTFYLHLDKRLKK